MVDAQAPKRVAIRFVERPGRGGTTASSAVCIKVGGGQARVGGPSDSLPSQPGWGLGY